MNRTSFLVCAALGVVAFACGGQTRIGEAGVGGSGGAAGDPTSGSGGDVATGGMGAFASGGTTGGAGTGGTGTGGTGTGGTGTGGGGTSGSGGTIVVPGTLPCDILQAAGHPCVAVHSTVRALISGYSGSLYQVQRVADAATLDIGVVDGYADADAQDAFCTSGCTLTILYDQSPSGNHLTPAPPGSAKTTPGNPVPITRHPTNIDGRRVYGMLFRPGEGYRAGCNGCPYPPGGPSGTAVGDEPQTIYVVTSQHDLVNGCCFDYGNAEVTNNNDGNGFIEAVYFGEGVIWGSGVDGGPWVMADFENGLYPGWENGQFDNISTNRPVPYDFVTAVLVGDTADKNGGKGRFALYGGDATAGTLTTMYDGIRPEKYGHVPMQKQGSVILSIGGDNSDGDGGRFYEGVIANGAATNETLDALQAAIVRARYGQ